MSLSSASENFERSWATFMSLDFKSCSSGHFWLLLSQNLSIARLPTYVSTMVCYQFIFVWFLKFSAALGDIQ